MAEISASLGARGCGIVCIAAGCFPEGREIRIGDYAGESSIDPKETCFDKRSTCEVVNMLAVPQVQR